MKIVQRMWNIFERLLYLLCNAFFHLLNKEMSDDVFSSIIQLVKFAIVGVSNTVISYVIYVFSLFLFQSFNILSNIDYIVSQIIQFVLSVLWSFYWNDKMVFTLEDGKNRSIWKSLIKTYVSYSFTGLFLSSILLVFWIKLIGISEYIAPILNLFITMPVNFLISKYWAFRQK